MTFDCPLCGLEFEGTHCHSSCPFSKGCAMVACPRCGYEFVQDGPIARFIRRFIAKEPHHATPGN